MVRFLLAEELLNAPPGLFILHRGTGGSVRLYRHQSNLAMCDVYPVKAFQWTN